VAKQKKKAKAGVKAAPKKKPAKKPVKAKARPMAARANIAIGAHAPDENTTGNKSVPPGYGVRKQTYPAPGMHDSLRRVQFGQGGGH
jgi:hypothetical protein